MQVAGKRHCRLAGGQRRKSKLSKYMALMANPMRLSPRSGAQQRDTQAVLKNQAKKWVGGERDDDLVGLMVRVGNGERRRHS